MIAFRDNLPLIEHSNGQVSAFERDWLTRSLAQAAAKAGYHHWWLATHVSQSVTEYLRNQREETVIHVGKLSSAVKTALEGIGYPDVAQFYQPIRPRAHFSLVTLAHEAASGGYELIFFQRLRQVLADLVQDRTSDFELGGLESSVRLLTACRVWSARCDRLRDEIIIFVRSQTLLAAGENEVTFALA